MIINYEVKNDEVKIVDPEFDSLLNQFGITPAYYERMSLEELAGQEVEKNI